MSRGRNWSEARSRDQMRRQGADNIADISAPFLPSGQPRRRRPSKAELRAEAEVAFAAWQKQKGPKP